MSQDSKYQKQRLIGSSERVDVYLGLNVAFGRKVAIKELRGAVDSSIAERNSFFSEYDKWAKLEHIRIARIEDLDRTRAWVIQEYLPQSMVDLAPGLMTNPAAAYSALEQILEGLNFLHQTGFIHFNLRSSNVRALNESIKLCDGRCIPIGFPGSLPKPRGSNRYLAPEMINEEFGNVGTATDIYVVGMIMLEALAGGQFESLFKGYVLGTPDTEIGWVRWHNSPETLDPLQRTLPHVPPALATLLEGMICKQVAVRYSSADRLLSDLRSQREAIVSAQPAASAPPVAAHPGAAPPVSAGNPVAPSRAAAVSPAPIGPSETKLKLIDRPSSPTYVRCLSGSLAGTLFPTQMGEILIGEGNHCSVRISADHCPLIAGREIRIWLGNQGWQIVDTLDHPLIVDSKQSFQGAPLRSGSIFRLSPRGPDFQFVVQGQHEASWQDIAAELDLSGSDSTGSAAPRGKKKTAAAPAPAPAAKPHLPPAAAPKPPQPASPTRPQPQAPAVAAPAAPPRPGNAPSPPGTSAVAAPEKQPMDKNKRNNLILFISLPIIAILIIFFMPQSKPTSTEKKDDVPEVEQVDGESSEKDSAAPETETGSDSEPKADTEPTEAPKAAEEESDSEPAPSDTSEGKSAA